MRVDEKDPNSRIYPVQVVQTLAPDPAEDILLLLVFQFNGAKYFVTVLMICKSEFWCFRSAYWNSDHKFHVFCYSQLQINVIILQSGRLTSCREEDMGKTPKAVRGVQTPALDPKRRRDDWRIYSVLVCGGILD